MSWDRGERRRASDLLVRTERLSFPTESRVSLAPPHIQITTRGKQFATNKLCTGDKQS